MGTKLQQILRSLCYYTEWNYAVFWKLKHRSRLMLTWEDAYYDNYDQQDTSESKCLSNSKNERLQDGNYSPDPLGLAVAKMSYNVYSLGEGIVGQVAATGKHRWIYADMHVTSVCTSFEHSDGWQSQFSAGIRTIVVVAVVPHGVVQLGSLKNVNEDMKMVTHIRDVFMTVQDSSVGHIPSPLQSSLKSSLCLTEIPAKSLDSEVIPDCLHNLDKVVSKERPDAWLANFSYLEKGNDSSYFQLPGNPHMKAVDALNKIGGLVLSTCGNDEASNLLQSETRITRLGHKVVGMNELVNYKYKGETSGWKDNEMGSANSAYALSHSMDETSCDVTLPAERVGVDYAYLSSNFLDSAVCEKDNFGNIGYHQNWMFHASEPSDVKFQKDLENLEFQIESSYMDTSLELPAGYELHEALGPAFLKRNNYFAWTVENTKEISSEMPKQISPSQMTSDSCSEHLLEAVVANICQSGTDNKSEKLLSKSVPSLLTTEKFSEPSGNTTLTLDSSKFSIDETSLTGEGTRHSMSTSGAGGIMSPKSLSSACLSACSELDRSSGPTKNNKKRARPGESSRPRPRDRQLIQDRIKELRELIPNGAKCSIDSLLERTVKHLLFLQSITKHADKLNKSADLKSHHKERNTLGTSSYEQGSSWAVEVGGNLKVCSIIVENLDKNGQMVVEMMCEDCSHFLEIGEAIRSLGLTILKGLTEARDEKTWICFVVEGENNRNVHRMDILWSLVQILQPKNAMQQS